MMLHTKASLCVSTTAWRNIGTLKHQLVLSLLWSRRESLWYAEKPARRRQQSLPLSETDVPFLAKSRRFIHPLINIIEPNIFGEANSRSAA